MTAENVSEDARRARPDAFKIVHKRGADGTLHFVRRDPIVRGQRSEAGPRSAGAGSGEVARTPIGVERFHEQMIIDPMMVELREPAPLEVRFSAETQGLKTGATA